MELIISIVTPSYQQGDYIEKTIESVLSQEGNFYIDYNILDGGSKDSSVASIQKYDQLVKSADVVNHANGLDFYKLWGADKLSTRCLGISYRWSSKPDKGQSDALNRGFAAARGRVFAWINSDDYYLGGALEGVCRHFTRSVTDVLMGNTTAIDHHGRIIWEQHSPVLSWLSLLYFEIAPPQPAIFFTKEIFEKAGGIDESLHYAMDLDLWCRFLSVGARCRKIERMQAVQTYHPKSKSCQGEKLFDKFKPECCKVRNHYKRFLGWRRSWFLFLQRGYELYKKRPSWTPIRQMMGDESSVHLWDAASEKWMTGIVQGKQTS